MKKLILSLSALFIFVLIAIGFLPTYLSTTSGNQFLKKQIDEKIQGYLDFDNATFAWFGPQTIKNLKLTDENQSILKIDELIINTDLLTLLMSKGSKGNYSLKNLNAEIKQYQDGTSNLQQALLAPHPHPALTGSFTRIVLEKFNVLAYFNNKNNFSLNATGDAIQDQTKGSLDIDVLVKEDAILKLKANASHFPVSIIDEIYSLSNPAKKGLILTLFGQELNFNIDSNQNQDFTIKLNTIVSEIQASGTLVGNNKIQLAKPATLKYKIEPKLLKLLGIEEFQLEKPVDISLIISETKNPIEVNNLLNSELNGSLLIDQITLYGNSGILSNLSIPWKMDGKNGSIQILADGITQLNLLKDQGVLKLKLDITNWKKADVIDFTKAFVKTDLKLSHFPVAFLERTFNQKNLTALMGPYINIDAKSESALKNIGESVFNVSVQGEGLSGSGALRIDENQVLTNDNHPLVFQFTISPDRFESFKRLSGQKKDVSLLKNTTLHLNVNSLTVPLNQPIELSAAANFNIDNLAITKLSTRESAEFSSIEGSVGTSNLTEYLKFNITGAQQELQNNLPFSLNGELHKPFNKNGLWNSKTVSFLLDGHFQSFPVGLFGEFLSFQDDLTKRIAIILGNKVNLDATIRLHEMQGPLALKLSGSNASFDLDAQVKQGYLFLNRDFYSKIRITKELGNYVLDDIFPLASGIIGSDSPLEFSLKKDNFRLPLNDFSLQNVNFDLATLNLGKVLFSNEGQLGSILSLFNSANVNTLSVWFTPLYMSLHNGTINFGRIDMLIMDSYPIATWGQINFITDRVDMMIGLSAKALKKGFNIRGLDNDAMLQLPLRGPTSNPSIDKRAATAKIAALVASSRGPEGKLIGTALNIASGGFLDGKPPEPTTNPLPWSTAVENDQDVIDNPADPQPVTEKKQKKQKPIHKVEDHAKELLRSVLPF